MIENPLAVRTQADNLSLPMNLLLLLMLLLPWLGAPALLLAGRRFGGRVGWGLMALTALGVAALTGIVFQGGLEQPHRFEWPWVPSLGVNLSFLVDGLSLFYGYVVLGMGFLIAWHAVYYLRPNTAHAGRFYAFLSLFIGAMLGTVFADSWMVMFIFWELTGVASFLLIGFSYSKENARVGARQALIVTGMTGLALFAGLVLTRQLGGGGSWSEGMTVPAMSALEGALEGGVDSDGSGSGAVASGLWMAALVLLVLGAFGKSAQFPFHFWLPNAMNAPTPVSAYLHSATMVKLGVYLCARLYPAWVEFPLWAPLVAGIGSTTLLLGMAFAFLSHNLKAILAWSTIGQLGFLISYYGLGQPGGVSNDLLHIYNHVLYKGSLFMLVGILSRTTGIYDIRELGGLWRRLPFVGGALFIGVASMAGLPGTIGFVSKELMLEESLNRFREGTGVGIYAFACVLLASVIKIAFSIRLFVRIFLGPEPEAVRWKWTAPSWGVQMSPLILAFFTVLWGAWPEGLFALLSGLQVSGTHTAGEVWHLWHGWTLELGISALLVLCGAGLYMATESRFVVRRAIPGWMQLDRFFEYIVERSFVWAKTLIRWMRTDSPMDYLPVLLTTFLGLTGYLMWEQVTLLIRVWPFEAEGIQTSRSLAATLIGISVLGVVVFRRWTTQLISLSVAGFITCLYFVLYRAPDLALTQILVETVTLIMVLLLLARFPRAAQVGEETHRLPPLRRVLHALLAVGMGMMATASILVFTHRPHPHPLGPGFLHHTVDLADGTNAVNTLLVDFRGMDTLGEITVLVIAMLGCLGLLMRYKRSPERYRQGALGPPGFGVDEVTEEERK